MTGPQVAVALLGGLLVLLGLYVGFRFLSFQLDQRWPDKVQVAPAATVAPVQHVPEPAPPVSWWEELEALRSQFGTLQTKVSGHLTTAENQLKLSRASEERARKMLASAGRDDEGLTAALPMLPGVTSPGGWDNAEPAPAGQALNLLEKRRRA